MDDGPRRRGCVVGHEAPAAADVQGAESVLRGDRGAKREGVGAGGREAGVGSATRAPPAVAPRWKRRDRRVFLRKEESGRDRHKSLGAAALSDGVARRRWRIRRTWTRCLSLRFYRGSRAPAREGTAQGRVPPPFPRPPPASGRPHPGAGSPSRATPAGSEERHPARRRKDGLYTEGELPLKKTTKLYLTPSRLRSIYTFSDRHRL